MELRIKYTELPDPIKIERISGDTIKVTGKLKIGPLSKNISTTLKVVRVGYSSLTLSCPDTGLLKMALTLVPGEYKKYLSWTDNGDLKISFRELTGIYKLDGLEFKETEIYIWASRR